LMMTSSPRRALSMSLKVARAASTVNCPVSMPLMTSKIAVEYSPHFGWIGWYLAYSTM